MALLLPSNASRPMSAVLRGFAPAACEKAVCGVLSVRLNENPCVPPRQDSSKKLLIYELETYAVPNSCHVIYGWALSNNLAILINRRKDDWRLTLRIEAKEHK
jgi:hypothetical protein